MAEDKDERGAEEESSKPKRSKKDASPADEIWMVWKGKRGEHTPPLPSHDLSRAYVEVYLSSMEEAQGYADTGLWELKIPDGALRKTAPKPEQG